VPIPFL